MFTTIMLGFSDGTKDGGYLTANWSILKAKESLTKVSRKFGIKVLFFDGRGGPPARGGGNTHQFYSSLGDFIESDQIQLTVQGQTISSNFGTIESSQYNMEQLISSGIKNRILSFFNSESGTHNAQSEKAIDSITSGGYFGKGIGEGTLKNRVPEAHTDYIISIISEEFGVIAIILILFLFLIFIYSVFKKVYLENEERIKLILVGCVSLILVQAMIHIGVNIRLFPTTGMTLPFLSYGGSSIISVSILSGIILNLTKRKVLFSK